MDTLRIFISSPGDVAEERERARQVVQGLRRRYAQHFQLEPIFWEDLPLSVDASFQEGIDLVLSQDRGVDVAVFILWSRMGSPVGSRIRRVDGREYRSGTERELDLMLEARRTQGGARPHILAYTRQDEAAFAEALRGRSKAEQEESLRQKRLVEEFIREEFHDAETGVNVRAYHTFARPQSFAERLRVHLQEILDGLCANRPARPVWEIDEQGPPFRGLEAFRFEHAEIFCGREDEVAEARARLGAAARRGTAFLLVSGPSGTGKSSLAAAGLVPEIVAHETDATVGRWLHAEFTPATLVGDPARGMARILRHAVPALAERCREADLAEALGHDPTLAVKMLLAPAFEAAAQPGSGGVRLVLLVDQLEELFSDPRLGEHGRTAFADILQALATSGGAWVIATLRGDWYPRLLGCPALVALKAAGAQLDLVPPGADAVRRMIESPAMLSGLAYERVGATSLADRILRDVADRAELLPLLEDLLRELFERRTDAGLLTFAAYEALGGIEGALAKRAEASLASVPVDVQIALPEVLRRLVATGGGGAAAPIRRRVPLASFSAGSPARALVEKLVADRLATASAGADGTPEVAIAHEAILRVWPRAAAWIKENAEFLRVRDRLAARMRDDAPLSSADPLLPAAQAILQAQRDALEPDLAAYVEGQLTAIVSDRRRRERTRRRVVAGLAALAVAASVTAALALWQWRDASRAKAAAETARDTAVKSRESAEGLVEFMTFNLRDKLQPIGRLDLMEGVLEKLEAYHEERIRLEEAGKEDVTLDDLRRRAAFFSNLGDFAQATGDIAAMREHAERAVVISEALVAQNPGNPEWRCDLAAAHSNLGLAARRAGDLAAARSSCEKALAVAEALAAGDPGNARWRHLVTRLLQQFGEFAREAGDLVSAREHVTKALENLTALTAHGPANGEWRHDLATTHRDLGDIAADMGDLAAAEKHYDADIEIMEALVGQDPGNADWRWDLANGHDRSGDVAHRTGDPATARDHYEKHLAIVAALVTQDSANARWRQDLARSHQKLGDLDLEAHDHDAARRHYRDMLEIVQALATRDPGDPRWQRNLAIGHERLGDLEHGAEAPDAAREHHERAFAIREALAARNPTNSLWQDDLAVSHARLGNLALDADDFDRAREHHERALAINAALAARDPENSDWQRGLAVSHDGLGNVARARGDLGAARGHYEKVVEVIEELAAREPRTIRWQRDLITGHAKLGDLALKAGDIDAVRGHLEKQLVIQEALAAEDPQNGQLVVDVAVTRLRLEQLDAHEPDRGAATRAAADESRAGPDGT